jgi:beta-glucanase (GH16 family)
MNMKKTKIALSILAFVLTASMSAFGQTPEGSWNLEWSDEFNGSSLNTNSWNIQTGNLGVNNELQTYAADRVTVGGGALTIFGSWDWDNNRLESGRINSQNKITWDEG